MAAKLASEDDDLDVTHDINVTPFIDVILVLLIIFMVAAPLATVDVAVDLPTASAKPQPRPDKPIFLSVQADLGVSVGESPVDLANLKAALDAASENDAQKRIFLRADKTVDYGDLMNVMNAVRDAGYLKIALVGLENAAAAPPAPAAASAAGDATPAAAGGNAAP
ncbi:TonB system transport protein ExbD [Zavarzinia sp. CC-PAN008]|uniref:TonB system transport protein ExbD n=1 Tax=Zavarzinia sp. CC-PAN008 TaxID=3243332 RepID=UPI003F7468FD